MLVSNLPGSVNTDTQLTIEQVQDMVGGMIDGAEVGITVTYNDDNGNLEFAVSDTVIAGDSGFGAMTPGDTLTIAGGTNVSTVMSGNTLTIESTDTNTTYVSSDFNHNQLAGFEANEHIDWTQMNAGTMHSTNYIDTDTTYTSGAGIDLSGTKFALDIKPASGLVIDSTKLSVDNSIIATITGSAFTGTVTAPALSGSLTHLSDGSYPGLLARLRYHLSILIQHMNRQILSMTTYPDSWQTSILTGQLHLPVRFMSQIILTQILLIQPQRA